MLNDNQNKYGSSLGKEYTLTDSSQLTFASHFSGHISGGFGPVTNTTLATSPSSTLVGTVGVGLEINLVWDSSVKTASNWSAIESSVIAAARDYVSTYTTTKNTVVNIAVGFGEVGGTAMSSGALGESMSNGYITNYSTVTRALGTADAGLGTNTFNSSLSNANFFVTSAEAKAMGLVSGTSTGIDGYIGLTKSSSLLSFTSTMTSTQYDATGVAAHEISEVMGRISLDGGSLGSYNNVYTPLDLFRTASNNFSFNYNGTTFSNAFNNPLNGGDAGDWATSSAATNAFNAFGTPDTITNLNQTDLVEMAALGYHPIHTIGTSPIIA